MSILIKQDELYGPKQDWPDGTYDGTVIEATVQPTFGETGTEVTVMLGNITTPEGATEVPSKNGGSTFNIGARKQFLHFVTSSPDDWRVARGRRLALQAMLGAGIAPKPVNRQTPVEFPYDPQVEPQRFADDLAAKVLRFTLKTRSWKDKDTGEDRSRQDVAGFVVR